MGGTPGELTGANRNLKVDGLWQNNRRNSYINYLTYLASPDSAPGGVVITVPPVPPVYEFDSEIFYDDSLPDSVRFRPLKETTFEDA